MDDNTDLSKKRNLSEVSANSKSSPIQLPTKLSRMNSEGNSVSCDENDLSLKEFAIHYQVSTQTILIAALNAKI